jgi:hypothetical protein
MKNIKLLQINLFNSFDIFYILLTIFILLYLNYVFFDQVILCDNIDELKGNMQGDLANLKDACHDYETLSYMHNIQKLRILHSGNNLSLSNIN